MSPERLKIIKDIFLAASECEPAERPALLDRLCAGDEELRREVEELLVAKEDPAATVLETPAIEIVVREIAKSQRSLEPGRRIGRYEILSEIGKGGGGEVYLALDTRLERKVALKLLAADLSNDSERLRRFKMEAKLAAALNHRYIAVVHNIEEDDGLLFITSEFVKGENLRRRIERGAIEWPLAVEIAIQLASALEAAHGAGIIHRDIKPENIMLRADGCVKLLDFGIAKQTVPRADNMDMDMARADKITAKGTQPGTPEYVSPEQAKGAVVDARTDIFSLGVLIYEMVTGKRPFAGDTVADLIAAILKDEPEPLRSLAPQVPAALERTVARALRKEPEARQQSARELLDELKKIEETPIDEPDDDFNPLLSEWDFSPRLRGWLRKNPDGVAPALAASVTALIAILLSRYVGAAGVLVKFTNDPALSDEKCGLGFPDLYFGYLIELNAGLLYLIGVPLMVITGFQLLNFAHVTLRRLASNNRLMVNQSNGQMEGAAPDLHPLAIIARWNRKLFIFTIPFAVALAVFVAGFLEYRGLHTVLFGWVQALQVDKYKKDEYIGKSLNELREKGMLFSLPRISSQARICSVQHGPDKREPAKHEVQFYVFLAVALGLQMAFIIFAVWIAVKIIFLFVLLTRALTPHPKQRLRIELDFEDEDRQFGLSGLNMVYNSFLTMVVLLSSVFLLSRLANIPKGTSYFSGQVTLALSGQALQFVIGLSGMGFLIVRLIMAALRLFQTVVEEHLKNIDMRIEVIKREIAGQRDWSLRKELQLELGFLQTRRDLAQQQRPWPSKNSLYRRMLLVIFLLLFILPIVIESSESLEGGSPLTTLMDKLARFLYYFC